MSASNQKTSGDSLIRPNLYYVKVLFLFLEFFSNSPKIPNLHPFPFLVQITRKN